VASEVAASGIATGSGSHSCAISKDRLTVLCWGRNDTGQLGNGSTTPGASSNPAPSIVVSQKPL
jgi:alpha-tubulin suppressor-like RCC1 family protein